MSISSSPRILNRFGVVFISSYPRWPQGRVRHPHRKANSRLIALQKQPSIPASPGKTSTGVSTSLALLFLLLEKRMEYAILTANSGEQESNVAYHYVREPLRAEEADAL